jgi:hypothetical protein
MSTEERIAELEALVVQLREQIDALLARRSGSGIHPSPLLLHTLPPSKERDMTPRRTFVFRWLSPLGASMALFLLYGAVLLAIGIQWSVFIHTSTQPALLTSVRTDTAVFGQPPAVLRQNDPTLSTVETAQEDWRDGMFFCFGIGVMAIAWFGLRRGERWALWTLTLVGLGMLPYAVLYMQPVLRTGAPWGLLDLPPLLTFQALVVPVAVLLAWIGLRTARSKASTSDGHGG